uniref:Uncharacterized protein n=1 Tax=Peronospora matthiolae TaxID=2874970 RepID=A0AAV1UUW1_9STRA
MAYLSQRGTQVVGFWVKNIGWRLLNMDLVTPISMDNQSTTNLVKLEKSSSIVNHVNIRFKFIGHYSQATVCARV